MSLLSSFGELSNKLCPETFLQISQLQRVWSLQLDTCFSIFAANHYSLIMDEVFAMDVDPGLPADIYYASYLDSEDEDFEESTMIENNNFSMSAVPQPESFSSGVSTEMDPKMSVNDFDFIRILGKGGFGKVIQVCKKTAPDAERMFAMKILKKSNIVSSTKETQHTISERNILGSINSEFICKLFYAFQTREKLYFVLEFLEGGELFMLLDREGILSEKDAAFYSAEIIIALEHLHASNIIYRDLKPENVMLDKRGHVKLTDFGLCKEDISGDTLAWTFCGTLEYMAPEIILKRGHNHASDWWSLGTLMFDLIVGRPPFVGDNKKSTSDKICSGRLYFPGHVTDDAKVAIRGLLKKDPLRRLGYTGSASIKKQKFFAHFNWQEVEGRKLKPPFLPVSDGRTKNPISKYFDPRFVSLPAVDSPSDGISLSDDPFDGFTYTNPDFLTPRRLATEPLDMATPIHNPKPAKSIYPNFPSMSFY